MKRNKWLLTYNALGDLVGIENLDRVEKIPVNTNHPGDEEHAWGVEVVGPMTKEEVLELDVVYLEWFDE